MSSSTLKRPGFRGGSNTGEWSHEEVRERAVRMVQEHRAEYPSQWAAIEILKLASAFFAQAELQVDRSLGEKMNGMESFHGWRGLRMERES